MNVLRKGASVSLEKRYVPITASFIGAIALLLPFGISSAKSQRLRVTDVRVWSTQQSARVVIHLDGHGTFYHDRLRSPNRIYIDVNGATVRKNLRTRTIDTFGVLKGVRIARYSLSVSRIVLDLDKIESYRIFSLSAPPRIVVDVRAPTPKKVIPTKTEVLAKVARLNLLFSRRPGPRSKQAGIPRKRPKTQLRIARVPSSPNAATKSSRPLDPRKKRVRSVSLPKKRDGVSNSSPLEMSLAERFRRGYGKVVIDPGHGGKDPGAIGRSGIYEKDIVLDISKRLAQLLRRSLRARVLLTRTDDRFLSLDARSAFANRSGADLFISVHANSSPSRGLSGIETYLLSEASDERALKVAARENGVPVQELSDLQIILTDLRVRGQINRSAPLAESVHEQIISNLSRRYSRVRDLGVKQAPFYVLLGAKMPSILVEVGFLSHRRGEDRLKSPKYRQALASSMSDGIRKFIKHTQLARQVD